MGMEGRRQWNDKHSVSMPFHSCYPVTVFPAIDWNTGHRVYRDRGYYDVEPVVGVTQDAETVYYENSVKKACTVIDVDDDDMESAGREQVEGYAGSAYDGML